MTKTTKILDRRRYPRIPLHRTITYEAGALPKRGHPSSGRRFRGTMINMSNGGMCFKTKQRLTGKPVLRVHLPVSEVSPVAPTLVQVRWVKRDLRRKGYRTGLRFII